MDDIEKLDAILDLIITVAQKIREDGCHCSEYASPVFQIKLLADLLHEEVKKHADDNS